MKLEYQVCTLEQAKRLKELGVEAESYFVWAYCWPDNKPSRKGWRLISEDEHGWVIKKQYLAYSAAELGVMLPATIDSQEQENELTLSITKKFSLYDEQSKLFKCAYGSWDEWQVDYHYMYFEESDYEAHAKADLLIQLLENKIIKPEYIKL